MRDFIYIVSLISSVVCFAIGTYEGLGNGNYAKATFYLCLALLTSNTMEHAYNALLHGR